jgi:ketosteroid isomerase-like protein
MVEDTSHEMSTESLEALSRTYAAWRAGKPDEALAWIDPEVVWTAIEDAPDAGTYRGHDGVLTYMNDWLQDFEDLRNGKVLRAREFRNKELALEATGLRE